MITLMLPKEVKVFNLNNFEREQALFGAWKAMTDDIKYANKRLKIKTDKNENLNLKISDIKGCEFDDCIYVEAEVIGKKQESAKPKEKAHPVGSYEWMQKEAEKNKRKKWNAFMEGFDKSRKK